MTLPQLKCFDAFTARLIRDKAKKLVGRAGFTASDLADLMQEFALDLVKRRHEFDASKAPWPAFVTVVVNRKTATLIEHARAEKRSSSRESYSLNQHATDCDGRDCELAATLSDADGSRRAGQARPDGASPPELAQDIGTVLGKLPPELRKVCELLGARNKSQAARELGISRAKLYDDVARIRRRFEDAGLRDYL